MTGDMAHEERNVRAGFIQFAHCGLSLVVHKLLVKAVPDDPFAGAAGPRPGRKAILEFFQILHGRVHAEQPVHAAGGEMAVPVDEAGQQCRSGQIPQLCLAQYCLHVGERAGADDCSVPHPYGLGKGDMRIHGKDGSIGENRGGHAGLLVVRQTCESINKYRAVF